MTVGILMELDDASAAVFAPGTCDTLGPFKDVHKLDCTSVFKSEGRSEAENADARYDDARDVWGIVGSEDNEGLGEMTGLEEGSKLLEGRG